MLSASAAFIASAFFLLGMPLCGFSVSDLTECELHPDRKGCNRVI